MFALAVSFSAFGQGTLLFSNFVPGEVDARFFNFGEPFGPEFKAQLFARTPGVGEFLPLLPLTTFPSSTNREERGCVIPVVMTVSGKAPGTRMEVEMRAYFGLTFETSDPQCQASANPVIVALGGDGLPPGTLRGMNGIQLFCSLDCMGLGEHLGMALVRMVNSPRKFAFGQDRARELVVLGDPTLRAHSLAPPSGLNWSSGQLTWTGNEPGASYYVYQASSHSGPFTRISSTPVSGNSFPASSPPSSSNVYLVRALKSVTSGNGFYWNLSQGAYLPQP